MVPTQRPDVFRTMGINPFETKPETQTSQLPSQKTMSNKIWALGKSPIKIPALSRWASSYPRADIGRELILGFSNGFRIHYQGPRVSTFAKNLKSTVSHEAETRVKINKEVELGRISGPFTTLPISTLHISPIGLVPKKNGTWRLITNLSYPLEGSINSFIDPNEASVQYSSFDKVVNMISGLGKGALLGKMDIKSAFRLIPIHPSDFDLLGFKFKEEFYIDKCLPMGCSISCSIFEKFATFIEWVVMVKSKEKTLDHYLDDFLFAGKDGSETCARLMRTFGEVCEEIGIPIAGEKTEGPKTVIIFLGLEIDTEQMIVRIPYEKQLALVSDINLVLLRNTKVTLKSLQSLTGSLSFYARAIPVARAFIRRMFNAMTGISKPFHLVRITSGIKEDLEMWLIFLKHFNGVCYIPETNWCPSDTLGLFTDSAGSSDLGCGALFGYKWSVFKWPCTWQKMPIMKDITFLELVPILLAVLTWRLEFRRKKIVFNVDNEALVTILNKKTSKSTRVMSLLRPLLICCMNNNIQFKAVHVAGVQNSAADALSRFQFSKFREGVPGADMEPGQIPKDFLLYISTVKLTGC